MKSMITMATLIFASQLAQAYGVLTLENIRVKSVNCRYEAVTLQLKNGETVTLAQNLQPMIVDADLIKTSTSKGSVSLGRQENFSVSLNGYSALSGQQILSIQMKDNAGMHFTKDYLYDASKIQKELLNERQEACAHFAQAQASAQILSGPVEIAFLVNSIVPQSQYEVINGFPSISDNYSGLAAVKNTLRWETPSTKLISTIQKIATCTQDNFGSGVFKNAKLSDGTPVSFCNR